MSAEAVLRYIATFNEDAFGSLSSGEARELIATMDELQAEVRELRIELDWRQGDTDTERARRVRDREQAIGVITAWRELLYANPDARTLGGPVSRRLWNALDELSLIDAPGTEASP